MRELRGDIFKLMETGEYDAFCITTNGFVKSNGECVMGRGIALECKNQYPKLPHALGTLIRLHGNHVFHLGVLSKYNKSSVFSFPVKHNWWEEADIELIKRSCHELNRMTEKIGRKNVLLPRPGCGNGKLNWSDVKPAIETILSDRIIVVTW